MKKIFKKNAKKFLLFSAFVMINSLKTWLIMKKILMRKYYLY